jgi:hypothetical protein
VFLRRGAEHHSLPLFPKALRAELGCSPQTTSASFAVEVGSYSQLRKAVDFLQEHGVAFKDMLAGTPPGDRLLGDVLHRPAMQLQCNFDLSFAVPAAHKSSIVRCHLFHDTSYDATAKMLEYTNGTG